MERGLLISRTHHGFVCANAGVDASNIGRRRVGDLPADGSRRFGRAIRASAARSLGVDLGVLISDLFGRPWRFGIVDVALGVAGFPPLETNAGGPMRTAARCTPPSSPSPTRSPRSRSSPRARRAASRSCSFGAQTSGRWVGVDRQRCGHATRNLSVHHPYRPRRVLGLQVSSFTWPGGDAAIGPTLARIAPRPRTRPASLPSGSWTTSSRSRASVSRGADARGPDGPRLHGCPHPAGAAGADGRRRCRTAIPASGSRPRPPRRAVRRSGLVRHRRGLEREEARRWASPFRSSPTVWVPRRHAPLGPLAWTGERGPGRAFRGGPSAPGVAQQPASR